MRFTDGSTINISVWGEEFVQCSVYFNGPDELSNMDDWEQYIESDEGFAESYTFDFNNKEYIVEVKIEG